MTDDDKPVVTTRSGDAQGTSIERVMSAAISDPSGFRTRVQTAADGSQTRLRTRGGWNEFYTEPTTPGKKYRGFGILIDGYAKAIIFDPATWKIVTEQYTPTRPTYFIEKQTSSINTPHTCDPKWRDVFSLGEGKVSINGEPIRLDKTELPTQCIPYLPIATLPTISAPYATDACFFIGRNAVWSLYSGVVTKYNGTQVTPLDGNRAYLGGVVFSPATQTATLTQVSWAGLSVSAGIWNLQTVRMKLNSNGTVTKTDLGYAFVSISSFGVQVTNTDTSERRESCKAPDSELYYPTQSVLGPLWVGDGGQARQGVSFQSTGQVIWGNNGGTKRWIIDTGTGTGAIDHEWTIGDLQASYSASGAKNTEVGGAYLFREPITFTYPPHIVQPTSIFFGGIPMEAIRYGNDLVTGELTIGEAEFGRENRTHEDMEATLHVTVDGRDVAYAYLHYDSTTYSTLTISDRHPRVEEGVQVFWGESYSDSYPTDSTWDLNTPQGRADKAAHDALVAAAGAAVPGGAGEIAALPCYGGNPTGPGRMDYSHDLAWYEEQGSTYVFRTKDFFLYDKVNGVFGYISSDFEIVENVGKGGSKPGVLKVSMTIQTPMGSDTMKLSSLTLGASGIVNFDPNIRVLNTPHINAIFAPRFRTPGAWTGAAYTTTEEVANGATPQYLMSFELALGMLDSVGTDQEGFGVTRRTNIVPFILLEMLHAVIFSYYYGNSPTEDAYPITRLATYTTIVEQLFNKTWPINFYNGKFVDWKANLPVTGISGFPTVEVFRI